MKSHVVSRFILQEAFIKGKVQGILNASSKICSLVVNGQSFLVGSRGNNNKKPEDYVHG